MTGDGVTVRFASSTSNAAEVAVYTLEGELVRRESVPTVADRINEYYLPLPGIASGLYLARLRFDGPNGPEIRTLTLAVEK